MERKLIATEELIAPVTSEDSSGMVSSRCIWLYSVDRRQPKPWALSSADRMQCRSKVNVRVPVVFNQFAVDAPRNQAGEQPLIASRIIPKLVQATDTRAAFTAHKR